MIYAKSNIADREALIYDIASYIFPFYMAPLLYFIYKMLLQTAQINEYFNIQKILLQKL